MSTAVDLIVVLKAHESSSMERLRELLKEQARLSLAEPGCERFEVYESTSVADTFVLVERWASQQALEVHRTATGFRTVYQPFVLPLVDRTPYICTSIRG